MDLACVELPGIDFRRSARVKCSPLTSSTDSEWGMTGNMLGKGMMPNFRKFFTNKRSSWLRSP